MGKWVSAWGNAMSITDHRIATYSKDVTLRYPVFIPFDGDKVRVTFDNYCGTEPVTITKAVIRLEDKVFPLSFNNGAQDVRIEAAGTVVSDELELGLKAGSNAVISFYLGEYTLMRSSVVALGPLSSGQFAVGDHTMDKELPIDVSRNIDVFYFLSNISVYTDDDKRALVCYGDSITAQDWPDNLSLILKEHDIKDRSVIRRATSGSRILREYDNITYESYGLKGTNRFEHEVPTDGADMVIIQQGINDIIHPVGVEVNPFRPMSDLPTVEEMIEGMKWYIEKARSYGYKVLVGTLLPIEGWRTYAGFRDEMRCAFNDWIRSTDLIDDYIDFDRALRDASNPAAFKTEYDSGDHLHPSAAGYHKMAEEAFIYMNVYNGSDTVKKAYEIAKAAHKGQLDKSGRDYITHPMTVASFVSGDDDAVICALLHDVVEDTSVTFADLEKEFSGDIVDALRLLTHDSSMPYMDYVRAIKESGNELAMKVKLADLKHNMDLNRLKEVTQKDIDRIEKKYKPALAILS